MGVTGNPGATLQSVTNAGSGTTNNILFNTNARLRFYSTNNLAYAGMWNDSATGAAINFEGLVAMRWNNQSIAIGTTTGVNSAILVLSSTAQGFLLPRMTTTQRNAIASPAEGLEVYDTTLKKKCFYNGTAWEVITSV